jgi:hypothetical protein
MAVVLEESSDEKPPQDIKCYIGRVPTTFTEEIVQRILVDKLVGGAATSTPTTIVETVELIYPHDDEDEDHDDEGNQTTTASGENSRDRRRSSSSSKPQQMGDTNPHHNHNNSSNNSSHPGREHRGFGFVLFATEAHRDAALALGTVRGGRKTTSKKQHTMYLRPYVAKTYDDDDNNDTTNNDDNNNTNDINNNDTNTDTEPGRDICYLWGLKRCPYREHCKFKHVGDGGCIPKPHESNADLSPDEQQRLRRKRRGKCFAYKKKGTCEKGEECPFSHDFRPDITGTGTSSTTTNANANNNTCTVVVLAKSEKDCINWKTKGKCRKGDKCVYKHDPQLQKKALAKIANKKRKREGGGVDDGDHHSSSHTRKPKQPLSVRVFGLNYDTTETDLVAWIEALAKHPVTSVVFPRFGDSNRSKGYCGVYFASPKAAIAAVDACDGAELHGRWLKVQTGKSMTIDEWEGLHH